MPELVVVDVALDPVSVGLFCVNAVMSEGYFLVNQIEQFRRGHGGRSLTNGGLEATFLVAWVAAVCFLRQTEDRSRGANTQHPLSLPTLRLAAFQYSSPPYKI